MNDGINKLMTKKANVLFGELLLKENPLEVAIGFIKNAMRPEEVFSHYELELWANRNGFKREPD